MHILLRHRATDSATFEVWVLGSQIRSLVFLVFAAVVLVWWPGRLERENPRHIKYNMLPTTKCVKAALVCADDRHRQRQQALDHSSILHHPLWNITSCLSRFQFDFLFTSLPYLTPIQKQKADHLTHFLTCVSACLCVSSLFLSLSLTAFTVGWCWVASRNEKYQGHAGCPILQQSTAPAGATKYCKCKCVSRCKYFEPCKRRESILASLSLTSARCKSLRSASAPPRPGGIHVQTQ